MISIVHTGWPLWLEKLEKLGKGWFLRNQLEKLEKYIYFTTQAGKAGFFKMTTIIIDVDHRTIIILVYLPTFMTLVCSFQF